MDGVALGAVVFSRTQKLEKLLDSVDGSQISIVYIADNGKKKNRQHIYEKYYKFKLIVIDVEYDSGLAYSRRKIVEKMSEDCLLLVDCDMTIPANVNVLYEQLNYNEDIGGICGMLVEDERVYTTCADIFIDDRACYKDIKESKEITTIAGYPFIQFDQISNAALFRTSCLDDYAWDPEYKIGKEHLDFYLYHKRNTNWKFGLCPSVHFSHFPGGTAQYEKMRSRTEYSKEYFLNKWDLNHVDTDYSNYIDTYNPKFKGFPPHSDLKKSIVYLREDGIDKFLHKSKNRLQTGSGKLPSLYQTIVSKLKKNE